VSTLKDELVRRLEQIPGVTHVPHPDRTDGFSALRFGGDEIGHFHNFNELDLRLGAKRIKREGLKHRPDSVIHPKRAAGSPYIELRFLQRADLEEIVRLVQIAVADR
jgi:hypothetical protein